MTFESNLPKTAEELVQRSKTDVQRELDKVDNPNRANAFLNASWLGAITVANGNRVFDYILQLKEAIRLNMPDTAEGEFSDRWGNIYIGERNPSSGSSGNVVAIGVAGSVIGITEGYQSSNGATYSVTSAATITDQSISVSTITSLGTIATVTTVDSHNIASNVPVTISGANESQFNIVDTEIQVISINQFTYTLPSDPGGPATGTILADFTAASVPLLADPPVDESSPSGSATNQTLDAPLTLLSTVAGVNDIANVDFSELGGGTDQESNEDYSERYIDKIRNPVAHFNETDIDQQIRTVAGVTRTFIQKTGTQVGTNAITSIDRFDVFAKVVTASPHGLFNGAEVTVTGANESQYNVTDQGVLVVDATTFCYIVSGSPSTPATGTILVSAVIPIGRIQIYFMRDDDIDPIPSAPEIVEVKDQILTTTPANTPDSFVIVSAPIALPNDFTFTELTPDGLTMRDAVTKNLQQFFNEGVSVGENIDEDAYRSVIFNTVDVETGFSVTSFALSIPSGDITVNVGEIPTLGTVTFP